MTLGRQRTGARGEDRAADWYAQQGYQVVDRNWRCRDGEIDLIATVGATLVICEVKARSSLAYGHPAEAVTPAKQRRLRQHPGATLQPIVSSWPSVSGSVSTM